MATGTHIKRDGTKVKVTAPSEEDLIDKLTKKVARSGGSGSMSVTPTKKNIKSS